MAEGRGAGAGAGSGTGSSGGGRKGTAASVVPRNSKGGVKVDDAELRAAFQFFDVSGTGKVTIQNLKRRLGPFYKNMPMREFKFLMGGETEITLDSLRTLLADNEISGFDPVAEAFKVYDPEGTGFADTKAMRSIFERLGFEDLSEQDMEILIETADVDRDGRISLDDFRKMLDLGAPESESKH